MMSPELGAANPAAYVRPEDRIEAEVREEFEHHLELLALREREAGADDDTAAERALRRFGDPARYARQCTRIVLGDSPM